MSGDDRTAEIKVGIFVLAAAIVLIGGSLWIVGSAVVGSPRVPYVVLLDDSAGVQTGDRVRIAGVSVGKIQRVTLRSGEERPVELRVSLRAEVRLPQGSTARVTTSGVLGTSFLQIEPGPGGNPALEPHGLIEGRTAPGFEAAMAQIDQISTRVIGLLDQASLMIDGFSNRTLPLLDRAQGILSEENAANLARVAANLDRLTTEAAQRLPDLMDRLDALAASAERGVDGIPGLTDQAQALMTDLRSALGPDGARLAELLETARRGLSSADLTLTDLRDQRHELGLALRDLRATSANLKAFSQTVKERPYSLVRKTHEPDRRPGDGVVERDE